MNARTKTCYGPGPGNHAKQYCKLIKDHLDYQFIVVRNSSANEEQNFDGLREVEVYQGRSSETFERKIPIKSKSVPELVIYNRVPKCGSTTMLQILKHVKDENNFTIFNQIEPDLPVLSRLTLICESRKNPKRGTVDALGDGAKLHYQQ